MGQQQTKARVIAFKFPDNTMDYYRWSGGAFFTRVNDIMDRMSACTMAHFGLIPILRVTRGTKVG